jgi:hypothetical protein
MMRRPLWVRTLSPVIAGGALAGCHAARSHDASILPPAQVAGFAETFRARPGGDSAAVMTLVVRVTRDSIVSTIQGTYGEQLVQHIVATFDTDRLRMREVRDSIPSRLEVLHYSPDRLRGTVVVQNHRGGLDTFHLNLPIDSSTTDRRSLLTSVRWLSLGTGRIYRLRMFDPSSRTVYPLRIAISAKTTIPGPAGPVDAYRVELTTRPPRWFARASYLFPTAVWVRADASRRIVRIERPRLRAVYDLTDERSPAP